MNEETVPNPRDIVKRLAARLESWDFPLALDEIQRRFRETNSPFDILREDYELGVPSELVTLNFPAYFDQLLHALSDLWNFTTREELDDRCPALWFQYELERGRISAVEAYEQSKLLTMPDSAGLYDALGIASAIDRVLCDDEGSSLVADLEAARHNDSE